MEIITLHIYNEIKNNLESSTLSILRSTDNMLEVINKENRIAYEAKRSKVYEVVSLHWFEQQFVLFWFCYQ